MSILKQILTEALASAFRRSSHRIGQGSIDQTRVDDDVGSQASHADRPRKSRPGIKAVILNWKAGENDPFSVLNATMQQHLRACGKNVEVIELTAGDWTAQLAELAAGGVEFALTWQGLGSNATVGEQDQGLWDHLKIPLICVHGDHPSHMPLNHQLESPYCFHLYANADAARYSNRHFRKARSASVIDIPQLHREPLLARRTGDHFVVIQNIDDPLATERSWRQALAKPAFDAYMAAAETLKSRIVRESYVEIHDVLDELIWQDSSEWLSATALADYHQYHSQLDRYLRSHKVVSAVTSLHEFPLHIYGRGWERIAQGAPASHVFELGRNMADSQHLYYSRYGLIDVSPSKGLHDRSRRAMANKGAFLSSANLEDSFVDIERFKTLFYAFRAQELAEKCSAVAADPEQHLVVSQQFAQHYHDRFHFRNFVRQIDLFAKSVPF